MMDPPPTDLQLNSPAVLSPVDNEAELHLRLPMEEREDGSVIIDLMPLAEPPPDECITPEPDPFNPEIMVCRNTIPSQRLGEYQGPTEEEEFGSAIPRAGVRLSDDATAEANATQTGVGGFTSQGGEVRVKIDF
ncbi:MAG: hypothetical protein AAF941_07495 [Pseudomonadota bacterium]